jgi:acetyl esterase/lipase
MRLHVALALLLVAVTGTSCTLAPSQAERPAKTPTIARLEPLQPIERADLPYDVLAGAVGQGARRAFVITSAKATGAQPTVIFLHGWGTSTLSVWAPWVVHLARTGHTVIFPIYQQPPWTARASFRNAFQNMAAGVRAAVARVPIDRQNLVVAGVSAGGALAADYAAAARRTGLPEPRAVYAVYPARSIFDLPILLRPEPGTIPARTTLQVVTSRYDRIAGTKWARQMVRSASDVPASRKNLRYVTAPSVGDHTAPGRDSARVEKTFWKPLDRLLTQVRPRT